MSSEQTAAFLCGRSSLLLRHHTHWRCASLAALASFALLALSATSASGAGWHLCVCSIFHRLRKHTRTMCDVSCNHLDECRAFCGQKVGCRVTFVFPIARHRVNTTLSYRCWLSLWPSNSFSQLPPQLFGGLGTQFGDETSIVIKFS